MWRDLVQHCYFPDHLISESCNAFELKTSDIQLKFNVVAANDLKFNIYCI